MIAYCDGGCFGNGTKEARAYGSWKIEGIGAIARVNHSFRGEKENRYETPISQVKTNNEAEYMTLIGLLRDLRTRQLRGVVIKMDSALVLHQLCNGWRVKAENLKPLWTEATQLLNETGAILQQVAREEIVTVLGH